MPDGWALLATDGPHPVALERGIGPLRLTVARDLTRPHAWLFTIDRAGATLARGSADGVADAQEALRAAEAWASGQWLGEDAEGSNG